MKKEFPYGVFFAWLIAVLILFLSSCNPPQSTPVTPNVAIKSDTTLKVYRDTADMWKRLIEMYGLDNDFGQGILEITIRDTLFLRDTTNIGCPQLFPNLKRLKNANVIINSVIDTGAIISAYNKKGVNGTGNVKPQTNHGIQWWHMLIIGIVLLLIGILIGRITKK